MLAWPVFSPQAWASYFWVRTMRPLETLQLRLYQSWLKYFKGRPTSHEAMSGTGRACGTLRARPRIVQSIISASRPRTSAWRRWIRARSSRPRAAQNSARRAQRAASRRILALNDIFWALLLAHLNTPFDFAHGKRNQIKHLNRWRRSAQVKGETCGVALTPGRWGPPMKNFGSLPYFALASFGRAKRCPFGLVRRTTPAHEPSCHTQD